MKIRASRVTIAIFLRMPPAAGSRLILIALLLPAFAQGQSPLFDGKSFAGWEGDTNQTWRIEAGTITAGSPDQPAPRNEFLATIREFGNFDLRLQFKIQGTAALNAGVQFRSKRIPQHHEVIGYQADIGPGVDGHLYDESRRNRMLASPEKATVERALRAVAADGWHAYRIRAEGRRIQLWLNGVPTVDYTEPDATVARSGIIALQIHGGMKGTIAYRDIRLEELPPTPAAARIGPTDLPFVASGPFPNRLFTLESNDVVVFTGQTDIVRSHKEGTLETALAVHFAAGKPRFRNMAWEGDTVYEQWRDLNFGTWRQQLDAAQATVIFAQFGQLESLDGAAKLNDFIVAYESLLDQFSGRTRRIVLLSPRPFEPPHSPPMPDHTGTNEIVRTYVDGIRRLAERRGYVFVDLFTPLVGKPARLTVNGMHLTPEGQTQVAEIIAAALDVSPPRAAVPEELRAAIREKNRLWFDNWRPMNWSFAFGDRTEQPFGKPGGGRPPLRVELEAFQPLIAQADAQVHAIAADVHADRPVARKLPAPTAVLPPPEASDPKSAPDHSPAAEQQSFAVADGFQVNLFASEADGIVKPLQMRWDDAGRLWVLCAPTYPQIEPGAVPGDYILVCEDTDADGRADKFTRFAEHLFVPMGIEFGDGGVYVGEASELVHLRDKDGDGKADQREVVLSGFGTADSHQMINGLERGPGGELWFTQGHHAYSRVETPWGLSRLDKAGVWRYRPRSGRLDSFFNLSSAGLNCQGVTHDDWGQTFHNSGATSGGFYTVPGAIPTLRPRPYWAMAIPDRRNTGIEIIGSKHLPDDLQGCLVWGGFMANSVQLHRLEDEGSGFTARVLPDLLKSSCREFRPVNVRVGPDGAIYVCDWYNAIIGHYQASYRDPARDKTRGRIWRIQARDRALVKAPNLARMSPAELLEQLRSPERLTRHNAQSRLFNLPTAEVVAATDAWLAALASADPLYENLLCQAIGIYEGHEAIRPELLQRLLTAQDYRARAYGTRVVGHWADRLSDALALLRKQVADPHPRVRLEAIVACSYVRSAEAIEVAARVLDQPRDRFIDYALAQAADALKPVWYPALAQGRLQFQQRPEHLRFVLEAEGTKDVAALLQELAGRTDLESSFRESVLALLVSVGSANDLHFALDTAPRSKPVLAELATTARVHHRKPSGDLLVPVRTLLADPDAGLHARGLTLAGAWELTALAPAVRDALTRPDNAEEITAAAITAAPALLGKDALPLLNPFAGGHQSQKLQSAAIAAMASIDPDAAAQTVAGLFASIESEKQMSDCLSPLLNRQGGAEALARALNAKPPTVASAKLARRVLNGIGQNDPTLMGVLHRAIGIENQEFTYDPGLVSSLARAAMSHGDARRGRAIYLSRVASCSTCHKLDGQGGETGPDLSLIGAGRSPEQLIESLLWPNRQVREGYLATTITTRDGEIFTGYKLRETSEEWQLRVPATGQTQRIAKTDVEQSRDTGSLMPEGLTAGMTRDELHDLIRFLAGLGNPVLAR